MQKVNQEQLDKLYETLKKGVPLFVALTNAGIYRSTYYYWVAVASVVHYVHDLEDYYTIKALISDEDDVEQVKSQLIDYNLLPQEIQTRFITPKGKTVRKYRNDESFRNYCDSVFDIIVKIDAARSEAILFHINKVAADGQKSKNGKINARASMWYLERVLPTIFARKDENIDDKADHRVERKPIEVVYVNPNESDSIKRIEDMTNEILNVSKGNDA